MGQAKLRGTKQERVEEVKKRIEKLKPKELCCNNCGAIVQDIEFKLEDRIEGVTGIYEATCKQCDFNIFGMTGDPEVIHIYMDAFAEAINYK